VRAAILAMTMLACCSASAQTIYKCQGADGEISYGSRPCNSDQSEVWSRKPQQTNKSSQSPSATQLETNPEDPCVGFASLAELIMRRRQDGADITQMYQVADGQPPVFKKMIEGLVTAAYQKYRFSTEEVKRKTISEFKVDAMLTCRDTRGK